MGEISVLHSLHFRNKLEAALCNPNMRDLILEEGLDFPEVEENMLAFLDAVIQWEQLSSEYVLRFVMHIYEMDNMSRTVRGALMGRDIVIWLFLVFSCILGNQFVCPLNLFSRSRQYSCFFLLVSQLVLSEQLAAGRARERTNKSLCGLCMKNRYSSQGNYTTNPAL
jgi:hypothetical protein